MMMIIIRVYWRVPYDSTRQHYECNDYDGNNSNGKANNNTYCGIWDDGSGDEVTKRMMMVVVILLKIMMLAIHR